MSDILAFDFDKGGSDEPVTGRSGVHNPTSDSIVPAPSVRNKITQVQVTDTAWSAAGGYGNFDPEDFTDVVNAVYHDWTGYRRLPDVERVQALSGVSAGNADKIMKSQEFATAIQNRGVPWSNPTGLTATQMLVAQIITNPTDKRPLKTKLKQAGVTYGQYRAWMNQPGFSQYLNNVTEGMLLDHIPDFNTVLTTKALGGDLNSIKYINELSGRHDPNRQQVQDLQAVVTALLDIITRNVKDPEVMQQIAAEFQMTMNSKTAVGSQTIRGEAQWT